MNINGLTKYSLIQILPIISFLLAWDSYSKLIDASIAFIWFMLAIILLIYRVAFHIKIQAISDFAEIKKTMDVYRMLSARSDTKLAFYTDLILLVALTFIAYFTGFDNSI